MSPHLDSDGLKAFENRLSTATNYLEYGCGGSTFMASSYPLQSIISIDSDREWVERIDSMILSEDKVITLSYCDIGEVKDWGIPINDKGFKNYWQYITLPWIHAKNKSISPDLVLIDGRFRVACFLYSLTVVNHDTIILFDDYANRPAYSIVGKYLKPKAFYGRMAEFEGCYKLDFEILNHILQYSCIYE